MSDPSFIYLLTQDYLRTVEEDDTPSFTASKEAKDTAGLKTIMTAEELFADIQPQLESSDFYQMVFNGQPGSGKTTTAVELAHLAHSKAGYKLIKSSGMELLDAPEDFVTKAQGAKKVCIVIDDASYVLSTSSGKTQSKIKNFFSMIRHALHAQILVIVIAHFTTAVPPLFKNSNIWLFSKPTTQEYEAMVRVVGRGEQNRLNLEMMFNAVREIQDEGTKHRDITLNIRGNPFKFKWGDKHDPGDGRLMLLLYSGEPMLYNSKHIQCDECKFIAEETVFRPEDYQTKSKDEEDNDDE